MLGAGDDILLHCGSHIDEVSGETGDTHDQIVIIFRVRLRFF